MNAVDAKHADGHRAAPIATISIGAKDAARAIGLPLRTLQQMTKDGKIPAARRKGKRYIYLVDELRSWVVNAPPVGVK